VSAIGSIRVNLLLVFSVGAVVCGVYFGFRRIAGEASAFDRQIQSMRADIARLKRENSGLRKQLTDIGDRLDRSGGELSSGGDSTPAVKPTKEIPGRLAGRISALKEFLSQHPGSAVPEMRLLKDEDWVTSIREIRLETEGSKRKAVAQLRMAAQARMGEMVANAGRDYMEANNGQAPSDIGQLAPYMADPANADLLQGFGKPDSWGPSGCLFQKNSSAGDWYGSACYISESGFSVHGTGPGLEVERAIDAFRRETGSPPTDVSQIAPYLKNSVKPETANEIFESLRPSPGATPQMSGAGGIVSYSGNVDP
jgi:hypothetical protein